MQPLTAGAAMPSFGLGGAGTTAGTAVTCFATTARASCTLFLTSSCISRFACVARVSSRCAAAPAARLLWSPQTPTLSGCWPRHSWPRLPHRQNDDDKSVYARTYRVSQLLVCGWRSPPPTPQLPRVSPFSFACDSRCETLGNTSEGRGDAVSSFSAMGVETKVSAKFVVGRGDGRKGAARCLSQKLIQRCFCINNGALPRSARSLYSAHGCPC